MVGQSGILEFCVRDQLDMCSNGLEACACKELEIPRRTQKKQSTRQHVAHLHLLNGYTRHPLWLAQPNIVTGSPCTEQAHVS